MAYPDPDYRREVIDQWEQSLEKAKLSAQAINARRIQGELPGWIGTYL